MLQTELQTGLAATWLPRHEGRRTGAGGEIGVGTVEVKRGKGLDPPFAPNGINYVATAGKDVISFNFGGCIMAV